MAPSVVLSDMKHVAINNIRNIKLEIQRINQRLNVTDNMLRKILMSKNVEETE